MDFITLCFSFARDSAYEQEKGDTENSPRVAHTSAVDFGTSPFCYCRWHIRVLFLPCASCLRWFSDHPAKHQCSIRGILLESVVSAFCPVSDVHVELCVERPGSMELPPRQPSATPDQWLINLSVGRADFRSCRPWCSAIAPVRDFCGRVLSCSSCTNGSGHIYIEPLGIALNVFLPHWLPNLCLLAQTEDRLPL